MRSGVLLLILVLARPSAAQDIYTQEFEGGAGGWTVGPSSGGVNWSVDATPAGFSPSNTLNCNNGASYAGAINTLSAYSPDINTQGYTTLTVSFQCNFETEVERAGEQNQRDLRTVVIGSGSEILQFIQLMHPDGPNVPYFTTAQPVTCSASGTWHVHEFQVTLQAQQSISISLFFWTTDGLYNDHEGWFIDDVKVTGPQGTGGGGSGGFYPDMRGSGGGSDGGDEGCGCVGADALLLLGSILFLRRRRRRR